MEDGLPGNAVAAIAKGGDGYLWLATLNGPARFDGARFVRVSSADGLRSPLTHRLLTDTRGRLWIGTQDAGLMVVEGGRIRSFTRADGLPGENVNALAEDAQGGIWVALDGGLVRWHGKFSDVSPLGSNKNRAGVHFVSAAGGRIFAVTDEWKLFEWRENSWLTLPSHGKAGSRFDQVFLTSKGVLWTQLYPRGLARLEKAAETPASDTGDNPNTISATNGSWRVFDSESGLPDSYISALLEEADGNLLCGSFERGLFRFREDRASPAGLNDPPEMDGVLALRDDAEGNLWVGTRTRGLLRLRRPRVRPLAGAEVVRIGRVAYDNHGRLWVGGGEGLWSGEEGALSPVARPDRLGKFAVGALLPANAGGVWIGAINGGLWRFDPDRHAKPVQEYRVPARDNSIQSLASDGSEGIWFGTASGKVGRAKGGKTELFSVVESVGQKRISVLAADPDGGVWAGTDGTGLAKLDDHGKVVHRLGLAEGLPSNAVRCLMLDREGVLWIGTVGGLGRWKESRLTVFDNRNGLPEDIMSNLAEDDAGRLWCAANNRLYRLDKAELEAVAVGRERVVHPMSVGASDGMKPGPFVSGISPEVIRAPGGRLLFPRTWEILTLDPKDFVQVPPVPGARIEEVYLDGQPVGYRGADPGTVRVPPNRNHVEIRYTALQWTAPEALRFRYRLNDEEWTEAGEGRVASFRKPASGSYRFEISAAAGGGAWANPPAGFAFIVEPVFWQTIWFRTTVILVAVGAAAGFGWRRMRLIEQRHAAQEAFSRRLLEQTEIERRRIASELHDGLGQNLVLVKNLASLDQQGVTIEEQPASRSAEIAAAADRALEEVHTISYALRPPELDRLGLAKALTGMVRRAGEASGIQFKTQFDLDGALPAGWDIQLFRIAQEAVNNLVKHSGAKTARVELWRDEAGVHLVVADDGRGLPVPREKTGRGAGLGLSGIEERARLLGAHCKWLSAAGQGTTLSVLVPF